LLNRPDITPIYTLSLHDALPISIPKYCKRRLAVGSVAVTRRFHVAEHLVVGAILLDDVDHVLDGALAGKKFRRSKIHQAIVLHGLLRIASQGRIVGQRQHADISRDNRAAVLPPLTVFLLVGRKSRVWRVWR